MIRSSIHNGIQLAVIVLVMAVLGGIAASRIPTQMIPDLEVRTISVETSWPGATPQDVEKEILIPQEDYLRTLSGLSRMVSSADTGSATIELDFPFGVDLNDALIRVNNALSQVSGYPENVDEPRLTTSSFSQNAFMYYRLEALPGSVVDLDIHKLFRFAELNIQPQMERVPGVSQVGINGSDLQIRIQVDPGRLAAKGLTFTEIRNAIRDRNRDVSAGDIDSGKRRYLLRMVGRFEDLEQLRDLIVIRQGQSTVRLRDVAEVSLDNYEQRKFSYAGNKPVFYMSVKRETGSNVIAIKDAMESLVNELNQNLLRDNGLKLMLAGDDVRYVKASIANVWTNLAIGAGLAALVMFLFLRSFSVTAVAIIGIPVCTIAAFIGLYLAGRTINVISLAGVAFAIGMTLDNSIVMLEAIERRRRQGVERFAASLEGAGSVWSAILASTLTTVLVFAPIYFIEEEAGQLFSDIAIAISASILVSMLVAITVIPSALARLPVLKQQEPGQLDSLTRFGVAFKSRVLAMVETLVASPVRAGIAVVVTLLTSLSIITFLTPAAEYLPEGEEAKAFSALSAPAGYSLTEMKVIGEDLNNELALHINAEPDAYLAGKTDIPPLSSVVSSVSAQRIFTIIETVNPAHIDALRDALRKRFKDYPGMRGFSARGSIISGNNGGTRSVNLDIKGNDLQDLYQTGLSVMQRAEEVFDNPQVNSTPSSLVLAQPLIELRPDWNRAAELGLSAEELGYSIAALTDGAYVGEYLLDDNRVDMFLFSENGTEQSLDNLSDLPLFAPSYGVVPLSDVVALEEGTDTGAIHRLDGRRTVTVNIIPPPDVPLELAVKKVEQEVVDYLRANKEIPQGVSLDISGASDQLESTRTSLMGNFAVALLLCYLLMVAIFSHWGSPLVILTTVPLGIAGGIVGLWLLNTIGAALPLLGLPLIRQPFDMITMLGFLILLGTVINNPILIVDHVQRAIKARGEAPHEAIKNAIDSRLKPMMMSTITTVFGVAPLVLIPGAGTELYRGIGAIVLFGLLFSAVVTLVFMPSLLTLLYKLQPAQWLSRRK